MRHCFFCLAVISGTILFSGCSKAIHSTGSIQHSPVMQIKVSQAATDNIADFSFDLFAHVQASSPADSNIFVSPLSLHMDLGMLLNGASGNTYSEIAKALQLDNLSPEAFNTAYRVLLKDLPIADKQVKLGLYNSMWYNTKFDVQQAYTGLLKDYFDAEVTGLPFNPSDKDIINQWASDKTNGRIQNVMDAIKPDDVMFLLNALYFKGNWAIQFDKSKTAAYPYHPGNGSDKQVQMMFNTDTFHYAETDAYDAVRLPYGNGQFTMTVLLPNAGHTVSDVLNGMDAGHWTSLQNSMTLKKIRVGLPRFTIARYNVDLIPVLRDMGIKDVFSKDAADLSKINEDRRLFVDLIKQYTYLNVDEEGTEAAAVTVTGITTTSIGMPPPSIICDHPFGIIISENTSNTILFMGRIMDPDSK